LEEQRAAFLAQFQAEGANKRQVCREWGVSPKTAYKWAARAQSGAGDALHDRSRRPKQSPRRSADEVEARVLALRQEYPTWGGRKLAELLRRAGESQVPAPSTIDRILERHGCTRARPGNRNAVGRFEREAPNELWQMDFKGHFGLSGGGRCHPLMVLDDHSRYCLAAQPCTNEQGETVRTVLERVFREHGLPEAMLMDNGSPWGNDAIHVHTPLVLWLIRHGIEVVHGRPRHPQTQGKLERLNRTLDEELLQRHGPFADVAQAEPAFARWCHTYNEVRPHESIGMQVPAQRYRPSTRPMPAQPPPVEYEAVDLVRKVQLGGRISFQGREWKLPKSLYGFPVALRPTEAEGRTAVYFCHQRVAVLNALTGRVERVRR
jgi:transposase InsO family protein